MANLPASGMPHEPQLSVTEQPPKPPEEPVLDAILDITKSEIATELEIAQRYETKARAFFGFAVLLFGAANAFVLRSNFHSLSQFHRHSLEVTVVIAGIIFGVALLAVMIATLQRSDHNITATRLFAMTRDNSTDLQTVVQEYVALLDARRDANRNRLLRIRIAQLCAFAATLATAIEFVFALVYFL